MRTISIVFEEGEDEMNVSILHTEKSSSELEDMYAICLTKILNEKIDTELNPENIATTIAKAMEEFNENN